MNDTAVAAEIALTEHQRGSLVAIDALLEVTLRDYSTPVIVPQDVRLVLTRLARTVCGSPKRAHDLIATALNNDEPASTVLPVLSGQWAIEDARLTITFDYLTFGGSLHLEEQADGNYTLTAADQSPESAATISLRLTADEMNNITTQYANRRDSEHSP